MRGEKKSGEVCDSMIFEGDKLRSIIMSQTEPIQVRDSFGNIEVEYERAGAALSILCRGHYYGIGNKNRIRFIRPKSIEDRVIPWAAELEFCAPKGACAEEVHRNHTRSGALTWKPRPDKSNTGALGKAIQLRIGRA
jgi:hypothetical protein